MQNKEIYSLTLTSKMFVDFIYDEYIKNIYHKEYLDIHKIRYHNGDGVKLKEYISLFTKRELNVCPIISFKNEKIRSIDKYGSDEIFSYVLNNCKDEIYKTTLLDLTNKFNRWTVDEMEKAPYKDKEVYFINNIVKLLCSEPLKYKEQEFIKSLMNANPEYFRGHGNLKNLFALFPELKKHYALIESGYLKEQLKYSDNDNELLNLTIKNKKRI